MPGGGDAINQRQTDVCEFKANLVYKARTILVCVYVRGRGRSSIKVGVIIVLMVQEIFSMNLDNKRIFCLCTQMYSHVFIDEMRLN